MSTTTILANVAILKKVGNMTVNRVPVNAEVLSYYLRALEDKRGDGTIEKLVTLPTNDLKMAVEAIIQDDEKTLNSFLGTPGEDVMDHIERSDKDVEKIGRRDKRLR